MTARRLPAAGSAGSPIRIEPLTPRLWADFERLFGARGACGGCWCMFPRLARAEFERGKGDGNRRAMRALVDRGEVPGVLGYQDGEPVGWCAVAPRRDFGQLSRSRILAPIDHREVWSIVCLFVARAARRRGVSRALVEGATAWARGQGATVVEAYPVEPRQETVPAVFAYPGLASIYLAAGFQEVARRSVTRPIMRRELAVRRRRDHAR